MGVVAVVVGLGVLGAVVVVAAMALSGRFAAAGREGGELLVAPRGAGFGEATRLVVEATRAERAAAGHADVVHLHDRRTRREVVQSHDAA